MMIYKQLTKLILFLLTLTSMLGFSQDFYTQKWKEVQTKRNEGQLKSTLPLIQEIHNRAMKDKKMVEIVNSLKAEFEILAVTKDDTKNDIVSQLYAKLQNTESELASKDQMVFQVLMWDYIREYFGRNYYKISGRTNMKNADTSAIETWTVVDFKNHLLQQSQIFQSKKSQLKSVATADYIKMFSNADFIELTPYFYQWYTHQEIEFLNETTFFTPNELKVNREKIKTLYDTLIQEGSGNARLYAEYEKFNFECSVQQCKDKKGSLQKMVNSSTEGDFKVFIMAELMSQLVNDKKNLEALDLAKKAKKSYPTSKYLTNIEQVEQTIQQKRLRLYFEDQIQSKKPIHMVVDGKNVDAFSLNIYALKGNVQNYYYDLFNNRNYTNKEIEKTLFRKDQFTLQPNKDYTNFKSSIAVEGLPAGLYLAEYVVGGTVEDYAQLIVSDIQVLYQKRYDNNLEKSVLMLVDVETGKKLANHKIKGYDISGSNSSTSFSMTTNSDGTFTFPTIESKEYYRRYLLSDARGNYHLVTAYQDRYYDEDDSVRDDEGLMQIFLDRKIYRPGQKVYFKAIALEKNDGKSAKKVVPNLSLTVALYNANGEVVEKQTLSTNEFGSVNGVFVLPKGVLNGSFSLKFKGEKNDVDFVGTEYFQVEEYKRPKFEVEFFPVEGEYRYGQKVDFKGKAVTYSGIPLSNVKVKYEIKKQNIRWRYFFWLPNPGNDNENSILGEVATNEKGEFLIPVELQKDETLDGIQVDNYAIEASVIDSNGETQSATTNVKVASVTHHIEATVKPEHFTDEGVKMNVQTLNYNNQKLKKSYQVKLSKIESIGRMFRGNMKTMVQDKPLMSKESFLQKFPYDRFSNDELEEKRKRTELFTKQGEYNEDGVFDFGKLSAGDYEVEVYNVEGKDTIKTTQKFSVWDKAGLKGQYPFLQVVSDNAKLKKGQSKKMYIYSAVPNALINVFRQEGDADTTFSQLQTKNGVAVYSLTPSAKGDVEEIVVEFQLAAINDVQTVRKNVSLEEPDTNLVIETTVFRDKLQPNQLEKWSVKVSGAKKEKVVAELLANMYDKSLDQFAANTFGWNHFWSQPSIFTSYSIYKNLKNVSYVERLKYKTALYPQLPAFSWMYDRNFLNSLQGAAPGLSISATSGQPGLSRDTMKKETAIEEVVVLGYSRANVTYKEEALAADADVISETVDLAQSVKARENLNETAFFFPALTTDKEGNINFEFTTPEALTAWKVMFLAHTKDARYGYVEKEVITQKEFSVTPNYPRFLREGDRLKLQSKISNLSTKALNGIAQLQILDALTEEDITTKFVAKENQKSFTVGAEGNTMVEWELSTPKDISSIIIKVLAKAGNFSDGEQKALAVLPNRMLVTDAVPIFVKEGQEKTFTLENLKNTTSTTVSNVSNTLELTTNPIWDVLFALPSLKDDNNRSVDVQFNKWFADVLASEILKSTPRLRAVFDEYQSKDLLISNLEKNDELKQILLEETPWVLRSKNETEQMQKISRLFDANMMKSSIRQDWEDVVKLQNSDGGFSWYAGYPSSYATSLYILKNLGRINEWLKGNLSTYQSTDQKVMVSKLVAYVDTEVERYFDDKNDNYWSNIVLDYLDTRHYWDKEYPLKGKSLTLKNQVIAKAKKADVKDFTFFGLHRAALIFDNYGVKDVSKKLMTYLKETSTQSETQGVYWKQNLNDWGWYSSKTINHAGALEAFQKLTPNDVNFIEEMKIWLITQKEVNSWSTSRGTAEVIYTILTSGKSWTSTDSDQVDITWGGKSLQPQTKATGYVKQVITKDKVDPSLATVTVKKTSPGVVQGGLFWQYYEDLNNIKSSESYISITKELYKKVKTVNGEELQKISPNSPMKLGDRITVRMILNTDRAMEFIHLKDMRAAGFEPVDVISSYQWKNNLGYYQSTKDASTNFYFQYMPKGKYVFEYDYICNAAGVFSNGITTLQNFYAPQMNAHSQGITVEIQ